MPRLMPKMPNACAHTRSRLLACFKICRCLGRMALAASPSEPVERDLDVSGVGKTKCAPETGKRAFMSEKKCI